MTSSAPPRFCTSSSALDWPFHPAWSAQLSAPRPTRSSPSQPPLLGEAAPQAFEVSSPNLEPALSNGDPAGRSQRKPAPSSTQRPHGNLHSSQTRPLRRQPIGPALARRSSSPSRSGVSCPPTSHQRAAARAQRASLPARRSSRAAASSGRAPDVSSGTALSGPGPQTQPQS